MNTESTTVRLPSEFNFIGKIFFYFCQTNEHYPHLSVCLAEGLKKLGIPFYSNINFWHTSPQQDEYLFCHHSSVTPEDCSVVVFTKDWVFANITLPENLFHPGRKHINVYLDDMDGLKCSASEKFDLTFRTHCNTGNDYPANLINCGFGLSNRILKETSDTPNFQERRRCLLVNFRHNQETLRVSNLNIKVPQGLLKVESGVLQADCPLRQIVRQQFFPLIQELLPIDDTVECAENPPLDSYQHLQWVQTGRRHYPNYYRRLKESAACACFGGWIFPSPTPGEDVLQWWDSWRFWESLAAGCVTFHVDFEKYGILLPVMPNNWQHYIGIDLDDVQNTVDRITNDPEILTRISIEGRQWAIDNYGPVPTTLRFLNSIHLLRLEREKNLKAQEHWFTPQIVESVSDAPLVKLRNINLIIFPDWSQPEESLCSNLEQVIRTLATHPDRRQTTLLVDTSNISDDDANLVLSCVIMNLLIQEDLEITEDSEISLIGELSEMQREALLPRLHARIILEQENQQAITLFKAEALVSYNLEEFSRKQTEQIFLT